MSLINPCFQGTAIQFHILIGFEHCEFPSPANQDLAIKYPLNLLSFWNSEENEQCSLYLNISQCSVSEVPVYKHCASITNDFQYKINLVFETWNMSGPYLIKTKINLIRICIWLHDGIYSVYKCIGIEDMISEPLFF